MPDSHNVTTEAPILIVGAGQAGATAAATLRTCGYAGAIVMVGNESSAPYERPPLSKAVLTDAGMDERIRIHAEGFHASQSIDLRLGEHVTALDTQRSRVMLSSGAELAYSQCLIATGGTARQLPGLPAGTPGVHVIRTLEHARALRAAMREHRALTVLGAGFLGLEVASTARSLGLEVTVLEGADRVLPRATPPGFSEWLHERIRASGVDLRLGVRGAAFASVEAGVRIDLEGGASFTAPLLLVAIGMTPEVALARDAGLDLHAANGGIRVDANCRTSAANVFAAGDCASQWLPCVGEETRLESWQNANEQARIAAEAMTGRQPGAASTPWFWTDQFGCNIQMLGMPRTGLDYVVRDTSAPDGSVKQLWLGLDSQDRLAHAIAVNAGGDLRALRALVGTDLRCDRAAMQDTSIQLRQIARDALAAAAPAIPS